MKTLKQYQENAVEELYMYINNMLHKKDKVDKVIFKAPTGAGKTFTATKLIEKLGKDIQDLDVCFLWISIGKGNLHKQSYYSVKNEISNLIKCNLLEEEFVGNKKQIDENEILFINWEKINSKSKDTGEWISNAMKDRETENLPSILENTRNSGKQIVLIIDESHYGAESERSLELIYEIIKPNLIMEMSATPVIEEYDAMVKIEPSEVVKAGMIKNEVLINPSLDEIYNLDNEQTSEELILEAAYKQREELEKKFKEQGINITPLVLIQIPNKDAGEDKKIIVESFLQNKGINYENGSLYAWLDTEEKTNITYQERMEKILPIDSKIKFLIFKQAIDTGWDCPRAQILVKFRETKSLTFEIQTLGRILRMPEGKHYSDETLNKAYVYTNTQTIKVKKEVYNPNIIKTLHSKRVENYGDLKLTSYYKMRGNQGDITSRYYSFFEEEFCNYFYIELNKLESYAKNYEKLKEKGIELDPEIQDSLIKDSKIPGEVIDLIKENEMDKGSTFGIKISTNDLQYKFEEIFRENLNGFPPARSIPTMRQALFLVFKKYLNIRVAQGGAIYTQNLVVKNRDIFSQIIDRAVKSYKQQCEQEIDITNLEKINEEWQISSDKYYNPNTFKKQNYRLSLYQPFFVENETDGLEIEFMNYLERHADVIEWFWKNGSEHVESNFGIKVEGKNTTFRPDFIVKFKDGRIGIFDTKGGQYPEDDKRKSEALSEYVLKERNKGRNLFGGLVVIDKERFRIFTHDNFETFAQNPNRWEYMDNLM